MSESRLTWRSFFSVLMGATITAMVFLWIAAGEIYDYEDSFLLSRDGEKVDVVVCLAGGKGRIAAAVDVWKNIKNIKEAQHLPIPILFLSGVGTNASLDTLADQGVPKEVLRGIKRDQIVFENVSENTFENAQIFSSFARQNHWKHPLLVTAGYHMRRALFILKKTLDPDVEIKTETVDAVHFDRNEWHHDAYAIRVTVMEYLKWLYYRHNY